MKLKALFLLTVIIASNVPTQARADDVSEQIAAGLFAAGILAGWVYALVPKSQSRTDNVAIGQADFEHRKQESERKLKEAQKKYAMYH